MKGVFSPGLAYNAAGKDRVVTSVAARILVLGCGRLLTFRINELCGCNLCICIHISEKIITCDLERMYVGKMIKKGVLELVFF